MTRFTKISHRLLPYTLALLMFGGFVTPAFAADNSATISALIAQLPTSSSSLPPARPLEEEIAAFGEQALPMLQAELRPGKPRRYAVSRVLAQMPGEKSTALLVQCLADLPAHQAMLLEILNALAKRQLSDAQLLAMLANSRCEVVLAGIEHANKRPLTTEVKAALERLFDPVSLRTQLSASYVEEVYWEVRLASGEALGKDMFPEIRQRVRGIIADLNRKTDQLFPAPADPWERACWMDMHLDSTARQISVAGGEPVYYRHSPLQKLTSATAAARQALVEESQSQPGTRRQILEMVVARYKLTDYIPKVVETLNGSTNPMVRLCAVLTLRRIEDRSCRAALWKALRESLVPGNEAEQMMLKSAAAESLLGIGESSGAVSSALKSHYHGAAELAPLPVKLPWESGAESFYRPEGWRNWSPFPRPPFLAPASVTNLALHKPVSSSLTNKIYTGTLAGITDGLKEAQDDQVVEMRKGLQWVQVDLGKAHPLYAIVLWHDHRVYPTFHQVIVQASNDPDFCTGVVTLFNNDRNNASGLGVGHEMEYTETHEGKIIDAKGIQARYVRCYSNGSESSTWNAYEEIEVYGLPGK